MMAMTYYVEPVSELKLAINELVKKVPCSVHWKDLESCMELTIECEFEDYILVEEMLASFV